MKKIRVEQMHPSPTAAKGTMSEPEFMLFAERVEEIFLRQIEQRAGNKDRNEDKFEVITEWL